MVKQKPPLPPAEKPKKTELIAQAITALGMNSKTVRAGGSNEKLLEWVLAQVGEEYREFFLNGFSVAKGAAIKKLGWDSNRPAPKETKADKEEPNLTEIRAVRDYALTLKGGLGELEKQLAAIEAAISVAGSYRKLALSVEVLKGFQL